MNVTQNHGFEFLGFVAAQEQEMGEYQPLAGSFAVIKCKGKYLMCFNKWRKQWELPAGSREGNETPRECASRELYEETGQVVDQLKFRGLLKLKNERTGSVKYNPVFYAEIEALQPFIENDETTQIQLWDLEEELGTIDGIDIKIFDYL
ncbi:NUDIX hydrolase [Planomicrobium chinense]|uniref:NUDIX domain-containing protein n=1 Tax=Planococcus chinensis TaxID=272917 RepID=UPI001CC5D3C5|nr:NUDIX hydrolase [Planococcus chinensis]MBZ5201828.1 NUDIX hydrolase [Planococcus chinensis]